MTSLADDGRWFWLSFIYSSWNDGNAATMFIISWTPLAIGPSGMSSDWPHPQLSQVFLPRTRTEPQTNENWSGSSMPHCYHGTQRNAGMRNEQLAQLKAIHGCNHLEFRHAHTSQINRFLGYACCTIGGWHWMCGYDDNQHDMCFFSQKRSRRVTNNN